MLDKKAFKLLKSLYDNGKMSKKDMFPLIHENDYTTKVKDAIQLLSYLSSLNFTEEDGDFLSITPLGRAYIEQKKTNFKNFIIPYAITTLLTILNLIAFILK